MRSTSIRLALVLCLGAQGARADAPVPGFADAIPVGVSAYASSAAAARAEAGARADLRLQTETADGASAPQSYWPLLYSALVPGLGEFTMGYTVRGIALMAVEVAAWTGYFVFHEDGLDKRDEYERFADRNWAQRKFIDHHPLVYPLTGQTQEYLEDQGRAVSGSGGDWWTGYVPWVSRDDDKQHYYENIGKYDWFVSGWTDYDPTLDPPLAQSELREQYRAMRNDSNDALDDANKFVWLSLGARVFSLAETAIIVHNRRESGEQALESNETPVSLRARPRGMRGAELALEVRFK